MRPKKTGTGCNSLPIWKCSNTTQPLRCWKRCCPGILMTKPTGNNWLRYIHNRINNWRHWQLPCWSNVWIWGMMIPCCNSAICIVIWIFPINPVSCYNSQLITRWSPPILITSKNLPTAGWQHARRTGPLKCWSKSVVRMAAAKPI